MRRTAKNAFKIYHYEQRLQHPKTFRYRNVDVVRARRKDGEKTKLGMKRNVFIAVLTSINISVYVRVPTCACSSQCVRSESKSIAIVVRSEKKYEKKVRICMPMFDSRLYVHLMCS